MAKIIILFSLIMFFVIYPLIIYWIPRMQDPYQLRLVFGKMGVGKTGLIAKCAMKDLLDPRFDQVYTTIGVPGTYKIDFKEVIENEMTFPPNSSIYVDEFGLVYNNRDFKSFPAKTRKWFKFIRQSRCKLTIFSQSPDVDKSVRDLCHSYGLLRRIGPFVFEFEVSKNIDVGSDHDGNGQLIDNYFKMGVLTGLHIHYLPRYFDLWKSFDPPTWEIVEADLIPVNPALYRAFSFRKFYNKHFVHVYPKITSRVAACYNSIYKHFSNLLICSRWEFFTLQNI